MEAHITQHTGSTVRLTCKASGKPKPEVTWYKNGVALQTAEVNNDITDRWMLKIVDIQEPDNGRYLCKVANKAGFINFTYNVHVTGIDLSALCALICLSNWAHIRGVHLLRK